MTSCLLYRHIERYDRVSAGKYTIGLGQLAMAVPEEGEDVVSMCLTAVDRLMRRMCLPAGSIGRIEVGSESNPDRSKSIKSHLMQLFPMERDICGIDNVNACYGGTAALMNTVAWVESRDWDGRYGLVVAGDIAIYGNGPARPTGGAGAVAILVGPDAPLVLERGTACHFMANTFDFFKPNPTSEYPVVDGPESIRCFAEALDHCYEGHLKKIAAKRARCLKFARLQGNHVIIPIEQAEKEVRNAADFDYFVFHSPYGKLVQKSFSRMLYHDLTKHPDLYGEKLMKYAKIESNRLSGAIENDISKDGSSLFIEKCGYSTKLPKVIGNCYTASVFLGIVSLMRHLIKGERSKELRIGLFGYGSGTAATMMSLKIASKADLSNFLNVPGLDAMMDGRLEITPERYNEIMDRREATFGVAGLKPPSTGMPKDSPTWCLKYIDQMSRRFYESV